MELITLVNDRSKRAYAFPSRQGPDGETIRVLLDAPEPGHPAPRVTVPAWYFEALCEERGIRARLNRNKDGITVLRGGSELKMPSEADREKELYELSKRARSAEARVAELMADKRERGSKSSEKSAELEAEAKEAKAAARAAEKRVKELEALLDKATKPA